MDSPTPAWPDGRQLWRCQECGNVAMRSELLEGVNPFCDTDQVIGCPKCKACQPLFDELCDEPGCVATASCGTPTPNGYRRTCGKHAP